MADRPQLADPNDTQVIGPASAEPRRSPRRRRARRIVLFVLLALVLLGGGAVVAGGLYLRSVDGDI
jgi:ferric-dicitrate binding protein FerR (iron transport regulator)